MKILVWFYIITSYYFFISNQTTFLLRLFFLSVQVRSVFQSNRRTPTPRMPEQSNDYRVVVFGAGGVGKSSLVLRFVKGTFRDTYIPTVEDTYRQVRHISAPPTPSLLITDLLNYWSVPVVSVASLQVISCDKSVCTLQITDTTGSHQFPAMQRLSISKGHAFILVYSITSRQSLEELKPIYQQVSVFTLQLRSFWCLICTQLVFLRWRFITFKLQ